MFRKLLSVAAVSVITLMAQETISANTTTVVAVNQVQTVKPYSIKHYNTTIQALYNNPQTQSSDLNTRIATDSRYFLDQPYLIGALGEGAQGEFDQQPLYRTDAFDCETYVDTVLALAEANNLTQFQSNILKVRYANAIPAFLTRNHFTSVDWNLNNEQNGFLADVTKSLFPTQYRVSQTYINKPAWFERLPLSAIKLLQPPMNLQQQTALLGQLHDLASHTQAITSDLDYLPLTALFNKQGVPNKKLFDKIPSGSVIEIVRPNWNLKNQIGTNLDISHMGIALRIKGRLIFREASSLDNKVEDVGLADYLQTLLKNTTVKGIHIEKIVALP